MKTKVAMLSGGVGGARLARGFSRLSDVDTTVIVNVGDDDQIYGLDLSPDLDTVAYTLAEMEGPAGWGRRDDTFRLMEHLAELGVDTRFQLGDADAALNLYRTMRRRQGDSLAQITKGLTTQLGISTKVLPATSDRLATQIITARGERLSFQEYFVLRGHRDQVVGVEFVGADRCQPAPGVVEAIEQADLIVIGPSNPPLSIWPILAISPIAEATQAAQAAAVSPLIGGQALKGPAAQVMESLGMPAGNEGVLQSYQGLLRHLVISQDDRAEARQLAEGGVEIHTADTMISEPEKAANIARLLINL